MCDEHAGERSDTPGRFGGKLACVYNMSLGFTSGNSLRIDETAFARNYTLHIMRISLRALYPLRLVLTIRVPSCHLTFFRSSARPAAAKAP
jgi:hypothetical protein